MLKVNFFCIGAQKAGTTLLHDILLQHPDVYLPPDKEAHFFDVNERFKKGIDFYETFFETYSGEKVIGNINPNLQIELRSIDRIIDIYGTDIKIIFLLRNPIRRAYSHYLMSKKRGFECLSFKEALVQEKNRIETPQLHKGYYTKEKGHFEKNHLGYIQRGLYSKTIEYLQEKFTENNLRFILFEDFIKDKQKITLEILEFLDLDKNFNFDLNLKSNPAQKPKSYRLSKFLHTHSKLKSILKKIIPQGIRVSVKKTIIRKNFTNLSNSEKTISEEDFVFAKKYFSKDIKKVERLINKEIKQWG